MAVTHDRLGELLEGVRRGRRVLVSPEGVPLDIRVAGHGERLTAFVLDMLFLGAAVLVLYLLLVPLLFSGLNFELGATFLLFAAFVVRNLYFLHFELAWQGSTPGKRICGLRVISREGGELTPAAVIARNLTREVEIFVPLGVVLGVGLGADSGGRLALLGWLLCISALPLFNRDHLRAGDLIGGTLVISMPRRTLLDDLTDGEPAPGRYAFSAAQLAVYGTFELQVLEELLRRPEIGDENTLVEACAKIRRKTGWKGEVPPSEARRFLAAFYAAQRAELERGRVMGRTKADKTDPGGPM